MTSQTFSPKIVAVGGGKGGIGKSMISSGIALALAEMGHKTLAIDLDLGGANLHTWLGEEQSKDNLGGFINQQVKTMEALIHPAKQPNLSVIHGPREHLAASNLKHMQKSKIYRHLSILPYDWIIVDLGAGSGFNVLDFFIAADRSIVVCVPEPTSIENVYRFIRASFFRKLGEAHNLEAFQRFIRERVQGSHGAAGQVPRAVISDIDEKFPAIAADVRHYVAKFVPMLLVNQIVVDDDRILEAKLRIAVERFLGLHVRTLGMIRHDEDVLKAIRKRQHPLMFNRESFAAADLRSIAQRVIRNPGDTSITQSSLF